jgi:hypothetical protein
MLVFVAMLLEEFLLPLHVDLPKIHGLARSLTVVYKTLAAESQDQFLPTPISESVLRPEGEDNGG